jgi:hypothetical protein
VSESFGPALRRFLDALADRSERPSLSTYNRVSPSARFRQLSKTKAGREMIAERIGVTERTQKAWRSGARKPNKANRAKIDGLYEWFAGKEPRQFPDQVQGMTLKYSGPSPWATDRRTERDIALPGRTADWSRIKDAYEGDRYDDNSYWDDMAYEDVMEPEVGSTSPPTGVGGVTVTGS